MDRRAAALVAIGGAAGAVSRHAVAVVFPASFPWGTLFVNVVGSFLLGILVYGADRNGALTERTRLVVSTGFVSSFTTYSAFAAETAGLDPRVAALNVVGTYALGLSAVVAAAGVVRWRL
ncbi:fluoride efflux transporter FluC [Natronomonas sp.]|uniref:fluoride efflux transporter FluC n=1 Tax=Natronomonas sp. TaxID=2184060 RepID=UPI00262C5526|nr:CrcB family protein [Natronomonas sp.]